MSIKRQNALLIGLTALFFVCVEVSLWNAPSNALLRALFKGLASLTPAAYVLCLWRRRRTKRCLLAAAAFFLCAAADVTINLQLFVGMALFAAAHVLFCAAWLCGGKPSLAQLCVYGALVLLGFVGVFLLRESVGSRAVPAACYLCVLFAMVVLSRKNGRVLRIGTIIFALSDVLLVANSLTDGSFAARAAALGVYYAALCLMAIGLEQSPIASE